MHLRNFFSWKVRVVRVAPILAFLLLAFVTGYNQYQLTQEDQRIEQVIKDARAAGVESRTAIVVSGRTATTIGCNRDFKQTRKFRQFVARGTKQIDQYVAEGTLTPKQGERAKAEQRRFLKDIRLPDCRLAQNAITDDPGKTGKIPDPLYPGHNKQEK
jgi:hypothetical protein